MVLLMLVFGAAFFESAKVIMLNDNSGASLGATYVSRFVAIATFLGAAIAFRDHLPPLRTSLFIMVVFAGLYVFSMLAANTMGTDDMAIVVQYATGVLYGVATAIFFLLYARAFAAFGPKLCAILFASEVLLGNCLVLLFSLISPGMVLYVRAAFLVLGIVLVAVALGCMYGPHGEASGERAWQGALADAEQMAASGQADAGTMSGGVSDERAQIAFPRTVTDWAVLVGSAFVASTVFGLVAQVMSAPGSAFALYDATTSVMLLVVDILLLAFMMLYGDKFTFAGSFLTVFLLSATGLALYASSWAGSGLLAGVLVRGSLDCSAVFFRSLVGRKVCEHPERTLLYFGMFRGLTTVYVGRGIGTVLVNTSGGTPGLVSGVSAVGLWAIVLAALVVCYLLTKGVMTSPDTAAARTAQGTGAPDSEQEQAAHSDETAVQRADGLRSDHALRIDAFATRLQLSDREREVVAELLHGKSRAAIARQLNLSPDTVKYHLGRVYLKAGVNSKQELVDMIEREPLK